MLPAKSSLFPVLQVAACFVLVGCELPSRNEDRAVSVPQNASRLWGEQGELWSPAGRLPDVSYAGYHAGDDPLPDVPVRANVREFGAVGDGVADDSQAFLDAIEAVSDGAILIPSGRYLITKPLFINKSHIVLRGESRDSTTLFFPKTLFSVLGKGRDGGPTGWSWGGAWIWANADLSRGDSNGPIWNQGQLLTKVIAPAAKGDTWIEVSSVSGIEAGQWVQIAQYETDGSLSLAFHDGHTLNSRCQVSRPGWRIVDWLLRVTKVSEGRVYFDRPFRIDVRPQWNAEVWTAEPPVEEVGIEHLTIEFPLMKYPGHHKEPGLNAISLGETLNSWVRDVAILNADNGIFFWYSRYCTAQEIVVAGRGGHYGFNLGGAQDCLVTRFRIENQSLHDTSLSNTANGNVYSWGKGLAVNFDHHRRASYQNVASRIDVGRPDRLWRSSGTKSGHYTAAHETYWNIQPLARTHNLRTWPAMNIIGRVELSDRSSSDWFDAWIEPVEDLMPEDIHLAQWARRKGLPVPPSPELPQQLPEAMIERLAADGPAAAHSGQRP